MNPNPHQHPARPDRCRRQRLRRRGHRAEDTGSAAICATSSRSARASCWPPRWSRWFPRVCELAGRKGALLVLVGYLLVHFFEHTITPHFHYGEETHCRRVRALAQAHVGAVRPDDPHLLRRHRHYLRLSDLVVAGLGHLPRRLPAQDSRRLHRHLGHAGQRPEQAQVVVRVGACWDWRRWPACSPWSSASMR